MLDLHSNKLAVLEANSFAKYTALRELYLQNNSIKTIKSNAFLQLQQLRVLDLSVNQLTTVPSTTFDGMSSLRLLNLRGNRITHIPNGAFLDLVNLRSLYLDGNYIEVIEPEAFQNLDYLEFIDLTNNNMRSMDRSVVQYFTHRLRTFKLYNNPWDCNCNIRWLEDYLLDSLPNGNFTPGDPYIQWRFLEGEPICSNPPDLRDKPFYEMATEDFVCEIKMYSSGYKIVTEVGSEAKLYCKYVANPFVAPSWTKNSEIIPENSPRYIIDTKVNGMVISVLTIQHFERKDIAEYSCQVANARGPKSISYTVTLDGIDPAAYTLPVSESGKSTQNTHTVTIVLSVIGGFLFLLVTMGFIIYTSMKCRRKRKKLSQQRSMKFKEHMKQNVLNQSDLTECKECDKPDISLQTEQDEHDPLYDPVSHNQTEQNGTYVSFKSDLVDPEEMQQLYTSVNRGPSNNKGNISDGSQCESTSPLLENCNSIMCNSSGSHDLLYEGRNIGNCTPIMCDSHDLLYETSNASSIYTPAFMPKAHTLNSRYLPSISSYDTYLEYTPYSTLSHCCSPNRTSTPPPPGKFHSKSASTGYIGPVPPKKPPRVFHSGDSMSMSQTSSSGSSETGGHLKLSLPKPGTVDEYGTAV